MNALAVVDQFEWSSYPEVLVNLKTIHNNLSTMLGLQTRLWADCSPATVHLVSSRIASIDSYMSKSTCTARYKSYVPNWAVPLKPLSLWQVYRTITEQTRVGANDGGTLPKFNQEQVSDFAARFEETILRNAPWLVEHGLELLCLTATPHQAITNNFRENSNRYVSGPPGQGDADQVATIISSLSELGQLALAHDSRRIIRGRVITKDEQDVYERIKTDAEKCTKKDLFETQPGQIGYERDDNPTLLTAAEIKSYCQIMHMYGSVKQLNSRLASGGA